MSYSIELRDSRGPCPTCKRKWPPLNLPDPTYNLTPIFDLALSGEELPNPETSEGAVVLLSAPTDRPRGLRLLNGLRAGDTAAQIKTALDRLSDPCLHAAFKRLEPSNGWGTVENAISVLLELGDAAEEQPDSIWEIQ